MNVAAQIETALELPSMIVNGYLADLTDDDLMVRPYESMNHIAWQLGHLISSENFHINQLLDNVMPALPAGFADQHTQETAASDDRASFLTKADYLRLMAEQRTATRSVLRGLTDEQLAGPSPASINYLGPTVGAVFMGEATHWMMHAGQWAVVRRKLGKPPLF